MADTTIKVSDNGPYIITGTYIVTDAPGNQFETKETIALCRCGHSSNKPFCDGSHKREGFESQVQA